VEAHGGELTATSDLGHGSTFRFTLPIEPPGSDLEPIGEG
jgi:chemotaxis family two-component system sensor kinase Cph1